MNIRKAKDYIKQTAVLYLKKNDLGDYLIPVARQRPVFLLGAPGVGKTAIMEQVAAELGIALVSYSMTHHTRQSAIGLPFIRTRDYNGESCDVTEYTMSEIIASMYETMEVSGIREGILFLDEINCVSETLAPSMLQFLQYKVFGRHSVPEGWVIVTAGNPPEYNRSVREFDVAVLDRLKVIRVDPDYESFREYASSRSLHPAITGFLDIKKDYFYRIENTPRGRSYVTARGWEDLSEILLLCESEGMEVRDELVGQYIGSAAVVREFFAYYELFNKYKKDYHVNEILLGSAPKEIAQRAGRSPMDERLSLLSMLTDRVVSDMKIILEKTDCLSGMSPILKEGAQLSERELADLLEEKGESMNRSLLAKKRALAISAEDESRQKRIIKGLRDLRSNMMEDGGGYEKLKDLYNTMVKKASEEGRKTSDELHCLFDFAERAFPDGNEMLILVTALTVNPYSSLFISRFGSPDYERHQSELSLSERRINIRAKVEELMS